MEKIRVFLVSDSIISTSMLTRMVKDEEDIELVGEAGTGQGGIIMLDEVEPHVVLLEVAIGGGMQIVEIVRQMKLMSEDIEIILCSDIRSTDKIMAAAEAGARDFLVKPYKRETVLRVIREAGNAAVIKMNEANENGAGTVE